MLMFHPPHTSNACPSSCPSALPGELVMLDAEAREETRWGFQGAPWIPPLTMVWATDTIFTKPSCPAWAVLLL